MKDETKKWIYKISFIVWILILYFLQWGMVGFFNSLSWFSLENIFVEIIMNLINYSLQLGLPIFLFYKGFIKK
jgi:hypothetical protein